MWPEGAPLALWGGPECTVNRVGDRWSDQLARAGHDRRLDDLDRFAELGLRTLRYPVLWERTDPSGTGEPDFRRSDAQLLRLRGLGITPIVGLLHHGCGPPGTGLTDPHFPSRLARHAQQVAQRYPWVEAYTPVNEPLTTARFSGLYGHWAPHARDDRCFVTALMAQILATVLSMRAIRRINPRAALVQTEDLGQTRSTPALAAQADFENHRRWLTWDLLCGRVTRSHPLRAYLTGLGVGERVLEQLVDAPCPPQLVGINHYVTSERFLDERLERYPRASHGGNARQRYADVEAVRVCDDGLVGHRALLGQAWRRYGLPLAVTEAHLACSPDEQVRWLSEVWTAASLARRDGADVRAVTAWALLGAFDWNSLVTRFEGHYEPGVFDVRSGTLAPTALAALCRRLAAGKLPLDTSPGWWRRDERLLFPAPGRAAHPSGGSARQPSKTVTALALA